MDEEGILSLRFVLRCIKLLSTCSRARIISMQISLRLSDRSLIIPALMFGFNGNPLEYFFFSRNKRMGAKKSTLHARSESLAGVGFLPRTTIRHRQSKRRRVDPKQYTTQTVLFRTTPVLFRNNIFIKVNDQHCVFFCLLEFVPVTAIQKNCFGKIFAFKTHPNFGGNF